MEVVPVPIIFPIVPALAWGVRPMVAAPSRPASAVVVIKRLIDLLLMVILDVSPVKFFTQIIDNKLPSKINAK